MFYTKVHLYKIDTPAKKRGWLKRFWRFSLYYGEYMANFHRKKTNSI